MFRKLYLVARTVLDMPAVQAGLAMGLTGYGIHALTKLAKEREQLLTGLNQAIGERRRELVRVTAVLRDANVAAASAAAGGVYPGPDDVDPLHRAEPVLAEPVDGPADSGDR